MIDQTRQKISLRHLCIVFPFLLLVFTLGCGKKGYDGEKLFPTTVTIQDSGKPVDGAVVMLNRLEGGAVRTSGITDATGKAVIMIDAEWPGAPAGKYKVRVTKAPPFTPDLTPEEVGKLEPNEFEDYEKRMAEKRSKLKPVMPEKVTGNNTPFEMEVTSAGPNDATFDIAEHW